MWQSCRRASPSPRAEVRAIHESSTLYNPFQYASDWQSDITNFTHFGQRWYAPLPEYGRWTQQDPVAGSLGNPISQCRYAYANDDPVN